MFLGCTFLAEKLSTCSCSSVDVFVELDILGSSFMNFPSCVHHGRHTHTHKVMYLLVTGTTFVMHKKVFFSQLAQCYKYEKQLVMS